LNSRANNPVRGGVLFWAWIGAGLILSSCGGGERGGNNGAPASRIEISPDPVNLTPGEKVQFTAVVRTSSGGIVEDAPLSWESDDPSIVTVDANGLATGMKLGVAGIAVSSMNQSEKATVGVVGPGPGGAGFALSGKALYQDRLFGEGGFTGETPSKPIRNAVINVIAIDGFTPLASGVTDANGEYAFSNLKNDMRRGGIYLQIVAKTDPGNPARVEIRNNLTDRETLALISSPLDDSSNAPLAGIETTATVASGIGGAFNILDVFSSAVELIRQSGPCPSPAGQAPCIPRPLVGYWEPRSAEGTFFDDREDAIFILGGGSPDGDADEYDDAVLAHEYGHFVMRHFSHDDSPGGEHRITDNTQDLRLSYSEGWGNFFSSALRDSPLYVDTSAGSTFSFNIENYTSENFPVPGSLSAKTVYDTNEAAVAGVLWDIYDPSSGLDLLDEPHDRLASGFNPIWQTLLQIQSTGPSSLPATMESFRIRFDALFPASSDLLQAILQERKMELFADATEGDEPKLAAGGTQHHTLYNNGGDPIGDEDIIPFDVKRNQSYTVETLNLTNAADTFLTIKDGTATLFENDNRAAVRSCAVACPLNDQITLSSLVSFLWTGPDRTLTAHVQRAPNAPASAGKLGAYDIHLK
jgi:hypothetical protein